MFLKICIALNVRLQALEASHISMTEASRMIGGSIDTTIPNNYSLTMNAINNGKVLAEVGKNSNVVKVYQKLAEGIVGKTAPKSSRWSFFN